MAIALPVLALYAASAKIRGDRITEAKKAAAEAEQAKLDLENRPQYIIENEQGVPILAPPGWFMSTSFNPEKIIRYKIGGDQWRDYTQEKGASTVPLFYGNGMFFTSDEHPDKVKDAVQAGHRTIKSDGSYEDQPWAKEFWYEIGKTEPGPNIEKQSISFTIGENTYTVEGQQGVTQKLIDLGIPRDKWPTIDLFSTIIKTDDEGNQVGVSQPLKVNLFGTPENPVVPEITIPYFITDQKTDDGTFLEVKQSEYDPAKHGKKTGSFSITTKGDTETKRTPMTDIELSNASEAIKQSDYLYSIKVGDEVFGGRESISDTNARILNVANQLNNSPAALTYLKENPDAVTVTGFIDGLFNDVQQEHEKAVVAGKEIYLMSDLLNRRMIDTVKRFYPSLLAIPGFEDKVKRYDDNTLSQLEEGKRLEVDDPENTEVAVSTKHIPNPTLNADPSASPIATQVTQHIWPKTYNNVVTQRLLPLLSKNNLTGMMVGDQKASRETLSYMALDSFIKYKEGIDGRPIVNNKGNRVLSDDQPFLFQFDTWSKTRFANTNVDELSVFIDLVDPRESALNKQDPRMIPIAQDFYDMTGGNILVANNIVYNLMPTTGDARRAMMDHFGFTSVTAKERFIKDQKDVAASSRRAIQVVNDVLGTYYMRSPSGELLRDELGNIRLYDSTYVGNLSLFAEGVRYLAGRASDIATYAWGTTDSKNNMLNYVQDARTQLMRRVDANGQPLFKEDEKGLRAIDNILNDISKNEDAKYAQRQFYLVVLAYEIAAAIQGGTGGRTISDQDVAMIMRGLRQGWSDEPEAQVNVLNGVRKMLQRFQFRADALSSNDEKRQMAYITTERLLDMADYGSMGSTYTIGRVVDELGGGGGTAPAGASALQQTIATMEDGQATYDAFVLGSINESREYDGLPKFGSLPEAKEGMEPTLYDNLVETANINFLNRYGAGQ